MKNAKKSMFITTVLMVAVLIVAVSTATFAWYTASTQANANNATLVAANSEAVNISVGWTSGATTTSITFSSKTVAPAVPAAAPSITSGSATQYSAFAFKTATQDTDGKFSNVMSTTDIWEAKSANETFTDANSNGAYDEGEVFVDANGNNAFDANGTIGFYVINQNINSAANLTMTCAIPTGTDNDNNGRLVVAVFFGDELKGIFTNLTSYYVGGQVNVAEEGQPEELKETLANGELVSELGTTTAGKVTSISFTLAANKGGTNHYQQIKVKAWLDGQLLTQEYATKSATFDFTFAQAA